MIEARNIEPAARAADATSSGFSSSETSLPLPRIFGRLLLLKLLARGGMGDVYLAATTGIEGAERPCVVKTVRRDHIHDGSFLARFLDEARVQSQLNHPGVAQVLEASTDENGEPFTVVEYIEGRSLADVRQRAIQLGARIGWAEASALAIEMGMALAHVHERAGADGSPLGIVHRDLSPQNVMIGFAGEVKLIDFGTARGHNRRCHTVAGVVFAKPGYVAPEVARQQVGDGRIDLYALGIMLWELCAGRRFLTGDAQKHLEEAAGGKIKLPLLTEMVDAPHELDEVIKKLTANDPDDRYPSAALASLDLARLLTQAPTAKNGERSVRSRIHSLMRTLWPHEPARSRAEFAKLLREARTLRKETRTPAAGAAMEKALAHMTDDPSMLSGTPYRIGLTIGEGASGIVYEAEHVELGRKVALKVLAPGHSSALDAIERFRREARAIAQLSHPNLVGLYDFGKSLDGRVFLAMELLAGKTLEQRLKDSRGMDWREAVRYGIEITRALEAAHGAGLVHRDLKPQNLFLTEDGGLKLLDFGVAMALADVAVPGADPGSTSTGSQHQEEKRQKGFAIFGTPEYMSPEQVAGEVVDGRCDIYALGCVLYELVTGSRVFEGTSSVVVMGKQLREMPESTLSRAPTRGIPPELDAIVMRTLAKAPEGRFATASALREALEETLRMPLRARAKARKKAWGVFASTAVLAALACAVGYRTNGFGLAQEDPIAKATDVATPTAPADLPAPPNLPASNGATAAAGPGPIAPSVTPDELASAPATIPTTEIKTVHVAPRERPSSERERRLNDARKFAKGHMSDGRALKTWATAAYRAGELREARRAADAWALHDGTVEPRLFLATVLEGSNRRGDAKAVLEEWLQLHPDSSEARLLHARLGAPLGPSEATRKSQTAHR